MQQPKSLYKLGRNTIYEKVYFCEDNDMIDLKFIQRYGEYFHFDHYNVIKMFVCKLCKFALNKNEIIYHQIRNHHREVDL